MLLWFSLFLLLCENVHGRLNVSLPFGDINVVALTDVHSWVAGHGPGEPELNVDYGHVLSFYQLLKFHCDSNNMDLFLVVNGDWIDGTGLTRADPGGRGGAPCGGGFPREHPLLTYRLAYSLYFFFLRNFRYKLLTSLFI